MSCTYIQGLADVLPAEPALAILAQIAKNGNNTAEIIQSGAYNTCRNLIHSGLNPQTTDAAFEVVLAVECPLIYQT